MVKILETAEAISTAWAAGTCTSVGRRDLRRGLIVMGGGVASGCAVEPLEEFILFGLSAQTLHAITSQDSGRL